MPVELAECFGVLIAKKYFSFDALNPMIQTFTYKWGDKNNRPHLLPIPSKVRKLSVAMHTRIGVY